MDGTLTGNRTPLSQILQHEVCPTNQFSSVVCEQDSDDSREELERTLIDIEEMLRDEDEFQSLIDAIKRPSSSQILDINFNEVSQKDSDVPVIDIFSSDDDDESGKNDSSFDILVPNVYKSFLNSSDLSFLSDNSLFVKTPSVGEDLSQLPNDVTNVQSVTNGESQVDVEAPVSCKETPVLNVSSSNNFDEGSTPVSYDHNCNIYVKEAYTTPSLSGINSDVRKPDDHSDKSCSNSVSLIGFCEQSRECELSRELILDDSSMFSLSSDPNSIDIKSPSPRTEELLLTEVEYIAEPSQDPNTVGINEVICTKSIANVKEVLKISEEAEPSHATQCIEEPVHTAIKSIEHEDISAKHDEPHAAVEVKPDSKELFPLVPIPKGLECKTYLSVRNDLPVENNASAAVEVKLESTESSPLIPDEKLLPVTTQSDSKPSESEMPSWSKPWISSDAAENADNNDPEWDVFRKLNTDEEWYRSVREKWRQLNVPDPRRDLTRHNFKRSVSEVAKGSAKDTKNNGMDSVDSRKRKRSLETSDTEEHPSKRRRTQSCVQMFDDKISYLRQQLDEDFAAIQEQRERALDNMLKNQLREMNNIYKINAPYHILDQRCQDLKYRQSEELQRLMNKYSSKVDQLERNRLQSINVLSSASQEVLSFNKFYHNSRDDHLHITDEERQQFEDTEYMYNKFDEIYRE